jgi:hypothetical protein
VYTFIQKAKQGTLRKPCRITGFYVAPVRPPKKGYCVFRLSRDGETVLEFVVSHCLTWTSGCAPEYAFEIPSWDQRLKWTTSPPTNVLIHWEMQELPKARRAK